MKNSRNKTSQLQTTTTATTITTIAKIPANCKQLNTSSSNNSKNSRSSNRLTATWQHGNMTTNSSKNKESINQHQKSRQIVKNTKTIKTQKRHLKFLIQMLWPNVFLMKYLEVCNKHQNSLGSIRSGHVTDWAVHIIVYSREVQDELRCLCVDFHFLVSFTTSL